ncbi:hypothetical protein CRG98_042149 [Punica granatum]|uniref:BTB domain-containing protein n=1 Tax=Punica granatum TaxID=22663 RepID=A0A2I0I0H5_PUNGR|nr:hypothetical protein CRG98_042149 [Punica granatum]
MPKSVQKQVAAALAHIRCLMDQHVIFLENKGPHPRTLRLNFLIKMLCSSVEDQQVTGARALTALANRATYLIPDESAASSSTSKAKDYTLTECAHSPQMHFVLCSTGIIEFLYAGSVDITITMAYDVLVAADQYLLKELKEKCEQVFAQVYFAKALVPPNHPSPGNVVLRKVLKCSLRINHRLCLSQWLGPSSHAVKQKEAFVLCSFGRFGLPSLSK